jgi:diaminohydroxyphosphoribosylaminopyrimidine deaminase/5-amino-6-(5-phosphoribosylamino)uracil reductase
MKTDEYYMRLVLMLARKGKRYVSPNPMVGTVIVKNGRIIGQGYHKRYGDCHAEVNAIKDARETVAGATLYVNLEPCCHEGKTPPCVENIIKNKLARVVIGAIDSNPLVSCRGMNYLQNQGVEVKTGVLENECRELNEIFFHYMETGMPFVTLKYAQTLDGRIATVSGQSQWISSAAAQKFAHQLRAEHDAVLVGAGTIITDNPELTVRLVHGRNPLRVVVASGLLISEKSKVFQNLSRSKTLIATTKTGTGPLFKNIVNSGVEMIRVSTDKQGNLNLKKLLKILAARGVSSVLVEGGAKIITSILKDNLANRMVTIIAPKIIGKGIEAVGDLQIRNLESAKQLSVRQVKRIGADIVIDSRLS